jgi:hypothetical protein
VARTRPVGRRDKSGRGIIQEGTDELAHLVGWSPFPAGSDVLGPVSGHQVFDDQVQSDQVCSGAHNGLKSDIAPGPKSANRFTSHCGRRQAFSPDAMTP